MNTKLFENKLNKIREELNESGFTFSGNAEDIKSADVIATQYNLCVQRLFESLKETNELVDFDFFEDMCMNGVSDKETINNFMNLLNECYSEEKSTEKVTLNEGLEKKNKTKLTEGTSNFDNFEYLPLLVFYTYEEVADMCRNDIEYPQEEQFEDENYEIDYEAYEVACEEFEGQYFTNIGNRVCILDEDDVERLEDRLYEFNEETKNLAYELDTNADGYQDYGEDLNLEDIKLEIRPGYYSAAFIDVENEKSFNYLKENTKEEQIKRFKDFMYSLKKEFDLTELTISSRASNGETGYNIVEAKEEDANVIKRVGKERRKLIKDESLKEEDNSNKNESVAKMIAQDAEDKKDRKNKKVTIIYGSSPKEAKANKPIKVTLKQLDDYKDNYSYVEVIEECINEEECIKEARGKGLVCKYKGYSIIDAGDIFVITDKNGLNVGETKFGLPVVKGMIDDMVVDNQVEEECLKEDAEEEPTSMKARLDKYVKEHDKVNK